ncbi:hypothetical protein [Pseudonocardia sp.]|uniref:hypothetical protein n=1 Tax=Pseudonocardia sp. TaxID=60912 RepID=UPI0031FD66A7
MTGPGPGLSLHVTAPVETVVQIGRMVVEPDRADVLDLEPAPLAGREVELTRIAQVLAEAPGMVLHGPSGSGTTALMLAAAARLGPTFPGGVRLARLGDFGDDPAPALRTLLLGLGVGDSELPDSVDERSALLRSLLAARPALLLLDDARCAAQVRALLPGGRSRALVTSVTPLPELALDDVAALPVGGLAGAAAVACTGRDDAPRLATACHGSPLALLLLAGATASADDALAALGTPPDAAAAACAAARIALRAAGPRAAALLTAVAAAGLVHLDAATAGALTGEDVGELVRELARRRLLTPAPEGPDRYALPAAVRSLFGTRPPAVPLPRACDEPPRSVLAGAAAGCRELGTRTGRADVDTVWVLERAAESAAATGDDRTETEVLLQIAAVRLRRDAADAALRAASRALTLADRLGDPVLSGRAVLRIAEAAESLAHGDLLDNGGEPLFDHAVALLEGLDDERHAHALRGRGRARRRAGRPSAALPDLRVALGLYRALGHLPGTAASWREIAEAEHARGERRAAVAAYRSSLHALAAAGDATAAGWARLEAGELQVGETPAPAVDALLAARTGGETDAARAVRALNALGDGPPWSAVAALRG